uniref:Uncharacterized protein n=1 Tax=Timema cristinae TaxID=61476 RepID=A0A7R9D0P2_TIMCR|nr:unnamed protein product [Timema cristinae]
MATSPRGPGFDSRTVPLVFFPERFFKFKTRRIERNYINMENTVLTSHDVPDTTHLIRIGACAGRHRRYDDARQHQRYGRPFPDNAEAPSAERHPPTRIKDRQKKKSSAKRQKKVPGVVGSDYTSFLHLRIVLTTTLPRFTRAPTRNTDNDNEKKGVTGAVDSTKRDLGEELGDGEYECDSEYEGDSEYGGDSEYEGDGEYGGDGEYEDDSEYEGDIDYDSPVASLVLTDSSQLTSDSLHLDGLLTMAAQDGVNQWERRLQQQYRFVWD